MAEHYELQDYGAPTFIEADSGKPAGPNPDTGRIESHFGNRFLAVRGPVMAKRRACRRQCTARSTLALSRLQMGHVRLVHDGPADRH